MDLRVVILAAGESSRLGYPKQTLKYQGKTLIERAIEVAKDVVDPKRILILVGGYQNEVTAFIPEDMNILVNPNWKSGMGSTISHAVRNVSGSCDSILFMPSDLPLLSGSDLQNIIDKADSSDRTIIYSSFDDGIGIPVLFKSELFEELKNIEPSIGAKKIILTHRENTELVRVPNAAFDIDTQDDVDRLLGN